MASLQSAVVSAIILCSLSSASVVPPLTEENHNVYQCPNTTVLDATPLCEERVQESGKILKTITKTIECPEIGVNTKKIACVIVNDNLDNDKGGYASIKEGGLEQYNVEIYLESQRGKGIDFTIEVYTEKS